MSTCLDTGRLFRNMSTPDLKIDSETSESLSLLALMKMCTSLLILTCQTLISSCCILLYFGLADGRACYQCLFPCRSLVAVIGVYYFPVRSDYSLL